MSGRGPSVCPLSSAAVPPKRRKLPESIQVGSPTYGTVCYRAMLAQTKYLIACLQVGDKNLVCIITFL